MNIPRYWRKAEGTSVAPDGRTLSLSAWGWSVSSPGEAERDARERLTRMVDRVARGDRLPERYGYGLRALREEIVEEIATGGDQGPALVTRNSYGSLVINTPSVMFIDVDVPEPGALARLGRLFSGKRGEDQRLDAFKEALTAASSSSFRIYRTAAGFRVLGTDRTFAPGSTEAERIMEAAGADPAYVQLCRAQRCFRARVTPKPWRCGHPAPPGQFPREAAEQAAFQDWLDAYERCSNEMAVCQFAAQVGTGVVLPSVLPVLRYHDERTRATEPLRLA